MRKLLSRAAVSVAVVFTMEAQAPPPLVESIEVNVVNVDVVVTDKSGKRITGLTQDDFEIFDRGQRRAITNFSEIGTPLTLTLSPRGGERGMARRRNTVIFFIDSTSIDPRRRRAVFEETRKFAGAALQPGDRAMVATWNQRLRIRKIADDFHAYYSIGFRPDGQVDGKERRIRVRAKNPSYVVRYRQSYVLRSTADEIADRVAANVHHAEEAGELVVRAETEAPVDDGRNRMRVPVKVRVEGRNLALIPRDGALAGDLTVFVCGGSSSTGTSEVLRHTQRLNVPPADEARFRSGHLTFTFEVILERKGESTISAGVLDTLSGSWGLARADSL